MTKTPNKNDFREGYGCTPMLMLVVLCTGALMMDLAYEFAVHPEHHPKLTAIPGFYALFGFVVVIAAALIAKACRACVQRREDYYE